MLRVLYSIQLEQFPQLRKAEFRVVPLQARMVEPRPFSSPAEATVQKAKIRKVLAHFGAGESVDVTQAGQAVSFSTSMYIRLIESASHTSMQVLSG